MCGGGSEESDSGSGTDNESGSDSDCEDEDVEDKDANEATDSMLSNVVDGIQSAVKILEQVSEAVKEEFKTNTEDLKKGKLLMSSFTAQLAATRPEKKPKIAHDILVKLLQRMVANLLKEVETKIKGHLDMPVAESADMIKRQVKLEGGGEKGYMVDCIIMQATCKLMSQAHDPIRNILQPQKSKLAHALNEKIEALVKLAVARMLDPNPPPPNVNDLEAGSTCVMPVDFFDSLEKAFFEDGIKGAILEKVNEKAGKALGGFVKCASQKLALLGRYEAKLASKIAGLEEEAKKKMAKFMSGNKLRSAVLSTVLNQGSKYAAGTGYMKQLKMLQASIERSSAELIKDGKELQYLIDEFKKLQEMGYTKETWKDSLSSLLAFLKLYQQIDVECGLAVLECICADPLVTKAIGATTCMIEINGDLPSNLLIQLNKGPGNHIRDNAYKYIKRMEKDLNMIQRIQANQDRMIALIGLAITSAFIGVSNVADNFVTRAITAVQAGASPDVLWIAVVVIIACLLFCCLCVGGLFWCVRNRRKLREAGDSDDTGYRRLPSLE